MMRRSLADFALAGRTAHPGMVAGAMAGTIAGASATVGTAQLAFVYGWSGIWFIVGAVAGCLLLGSVLAQPLRDTSAETISEVLARSYGPGARLVASLVASLGMLLSIVSQLLAAVALLSVLFGLPPGYAAGFSTGLMAVYVLRRGLRALGAMGLVKIGLLYLTFAVAAIGGYRSLGHGVLYDGWPPSFSASLFGRGVVADLDAGVSILVGVVSTQVYVQAITAGRSLQAARRGAYLSASLLVPIGIASVLIGIIMRIHMPELPPLLAFPTFLTHFVDPWIGSALIAVLLLNVIGSGAGLALGISTTLTRDLGALRQLPMSEPTALRVSRALIILTLGVALVIVASHSGQFILHWAFLAFGVRGASICLPFVAALLCGGTISARTGFVAILAGLFAVVVAGAWLPGHVHATYVGLAASGAVLLAGALVRRWTARESVALNGPLHGSPGGR